MDTLRVQGTELAVPADRGVGGEVFDVELELAARVTVEGRLTTWTEATGRFDLVLVPRHGVDPPAPFACENAAPCAPDPEGRFDFERIAPGLARPEARSMARNP